MLHRDYVPGIDEELEREEEAAEKRLRYEALLLENDEEVEGIAALTRRTLARHKKRYSRQRLMYALRHYREFGFVQWVDGKPFSMQSSWDNLDFGTIETRILDEQRRRGAARGKLNKEFPALGIDQSSGSNIAAGAAHETTVSNASNLVTTPVTTPGRSKPI